MNNVPNRPEKKRGRPSTVDATIDQFVNRIASLIDADESALSAEWKNELSRLSNRSASTINIFASRYRKAVRKQLGTDHPVLSVMSVSSDVLPQTQPSSAHTIDDFVGRISALKGTYDEVMPQAHALWHEELALIRESFAANTIINRVTQYRKRLAELDVPFIETIVSMIAVPDELKQKRNFLINKDRAYQRVADLMSNWPDVIRTLEQHLIDHNTIWRNILDIATSSVSAEALVSPIRQLMAIHMLTGLNLEEILQPNGLAPYKLDSDNSYGAIYHAHQLRTASSDVIITLAPSKLIFGTWLTLMNSNQGKEWSALPHSRLLLKISRRSLKSPSEEQNNIYACADAVLADFIDHPMTKRRVIDFYNSVCDLKRQK